MIIDLKLGGVSFGCIEWRMTCPWIRNSWMWNGFEQTATHNNRKYMIDIFLVKLTFEILTVRGQQHSFSTHERMFLWKCQSFWDRKCLDLWGTRTPNLRIYAEGSNHLSCQGQTFSVPCFFNTGSCSEDIFLVKLTFEMLTVRRISTIIFPLHLDNCFPLHGHPVIIDKIMTTPLMTITIKLQVILII